MSGPPLASSTPASHSRLRRSPSASAAGSRSAPWRSSWPTATRASRRCATTWPAASSQMRQAQARSRPARPGGGSRRSSRDGDRRRAHGRRDQAAAAERDGAVSGAPAARAARELRRAERLRQLRQDELRHGRLPGQRLLHHRQARRRRARREPSKAASRDASTCDQDSLQGQGPDGAASSMPATPNVEVHTGDWAIIRVREHDRPAAAADRHRRTPTTSPSRSSASATTTRRASS